MACSCCDFTGPAGQQFNAQKAAKQLKGYRRGAVPPTTRLLRDDVVAAGLNQGALLDVGAGIGALTFELLDRGMSNAVAVEASHAYLDAAREEAARRQRLESVSFLHGDFALLALDVSIADLVTLDRVVCCYPDYKSLLAEAAQHARRGVALSYPRDRWFVRWGMRIENAIRSRLGSSTFRTFVHPVADMDRLIRNAGFELASRSQTAVWAADTYIRRRAISSASVPPPSA
jgi:magnesium-protoporphyrin O-methyltransferase